MRICRHCIFDVIRSNWQFILMLTIIFIGGIVLGIVVAVNTSFSAPTNPFALLQTGNYGAFKYFFIYTLMALLICIIMWLNNINKLFIILSISLIFYVGYKLGYNCVESVNAAIGSGILSIIIFYIPIFFANLVAIMTMLKYSSRNWLRCKSNLTCPFLLKKAAKFCLINFFWLTIVIFIFTVLLPSILKLILY